MSQELFLHIYTTDSADPLYATLDSMEDMKLVNGFYFFPSKRGKRFMINQSNILRIEVQENKAKEAK